MKNKRRFAEYTQMRQNSQQPYTRGGLRKTEKRMHWEVIIEEEIIWDNRKKGLGSWQDYAAVNNEP